MKRIVLFVSIVLLLTGCKTTYDYGYDVRQLRAGMTKYEVERLIGPAERILEINWTPYGYEEILQYRDRYWDRYALIYMEGILIDAQYIYDGSWYYVQATRPPMGGGIFPPGFIPGRPVPMPPHYDPPINRPPSDNNLPEAKPRPPLNNNNSSSSNRPESSRPGNTSSSRPSSSRPANTESSTSGSRQSNPSRETTGTRSNSSSGSTRESSSGRSSSSSSGSQSNTSQDSNGSRSSRNK